MEVDGAGGGGSPRDADDEEERRSPSWGSGQRQARALQAFVEISPATVVAGGGRGEGDDVERETTGGGRE